MIRCKDINQNEQVTRRMLATERNNFAKSRQEWIQAAFDLAFHNDDHAFRTLVDEELCDNCKKTYEKHSIKTT